VFFGKESDKSSEEKPVEQPIGGKPSVQPQPKLVRFYCDYCRRDGHKGEFFFKRKREERMAKEWANKDRYNPSHGVPQPRMPLPRGKAVVRSVSAWGDVSSRSRGGSLERVVRLAWRGGQTGPAQREWLDQPGKAVRPRPQNSGWFGF
jgi:ribosomal protein L44E